MTKPGSSDDDECSVRTENSRDRFNKKSDIKGERQPTHPEWKLINMPVEVQVELTQKGAFMEHCHYATTKLGGELAPREIAAQIKTVGAEHCVMATDHGNKLISDPIDGMKVYVEDMMNSGISKEEIGRMTKENPTKLLDLH